MGHTQPGREVSNYHNFVDKLLSPPMPIFMDRHDIPEATAEKVAEAHQKDLAIQQKFNCRALTYWFDDERGMAFCLIEAPDRQSVQDLHDYAHGLIPNEIIEVEPTVVESFLGRIEDPDDAKNASTPVIRDPAFRSILYVSVTPVGTGRQESEEQRSHQYIEQVFDKNLKQHNGLEVSHSYNRFLASFASIEDAVRCAGALQSAIYSRSLYMEVGMGVSAGVPVSGNSEFFEKAVNLAKKLSSIAKHGRFVISSNVAEGVKPDTLSQSDYSALNQQEERLLIDLIDVLDGNACDPDFNVKAFSEEMGMSKSKLYRNSIDLLQTSPNEAIKEHRLRKALELVRAKYGSISEIAYRSGFNSLSYFSRCFQERFKLLPSAYMELS